MNEPTPEEVAASIDLPMSGRGRGSEWVWELDRSVINENIAAAIRAAEQRGRDEERLSRKKCEGCGVHGDVQFISVRVTNGVLNLCRQCLDDINRKSPLLITARLAGWEEAREACIAKAKYIRDTYLDQMEGADEEDFILANFALGACSQVVNAIAALKPGETQGETS